MANYCEKCSDLITINDLIICSSCSSKLHSSCAGLKEKTFKEMLPMNKKKWKCGECKQPKPASTPARDGQSLLSIDFDKLTAYIDKKLENFREEIRKDFCKHIEKEMCEIKESISFMSNTFDDIKATLANNSKLIKELKSENQQIRAQNNDLQNRLHAVEQQSRECNIELQCVPEDRAENLVNLSMQLSSIVKGGLQVNDILSVHRVAKLDKNSQRPRSIIIKLSSPRCRDSFLAAAKHFNKSNSNDRLNSSHLGVGGDAKKPIYVCEHLPLATKQLHAATRIFARENSFKFVWIRNGRVYLRKDEQSQGHIIGDTGKLNMFKH